VKWGEGEVDGANRVAAKFRSAKGGSGPNCGKVLWAQTGFLPARSNIKDLEGFARYHGEGETAPKYLTSALAEGAVDLNDFAHGSFWQVLNTWRDGWH
jgi:hypothetical protein